MPENTPAPAAPSPATDAPQEPTAVAPAAPPAPAPAAPAEPASPWDDPTAAKAEIERLRQENGAARINAKAQAAEEARNELAQQIGKALGLVKDEPVDPAKLTEQLTQSQTDAVQAKVELAVFKAAGAAGGDPLALLDSSSFLAKVANLDPSDSAAITAAITAAVTANPRLGAAPATGTPAPAPNPAQGSSGSGPANTPAQLSRADIERMTPEQVVEAQAKGQLDNLLAGR